jgi:chromosome segregation ATPase
MTHATQQTQQLQAQLMASEAERQRLQQELNALSISHEALTARCAQLEHIRQMDRGSREVAAAVTAPLQMLHQRLAQQQEGSQQLNAHNAPQVPVVDSKYSGNITPGADNTNEQLQRAKQAVAASLMLEEEHSMQLQQLTEDTKELQKALAAANECAVAAEARESTTNQQLAGLHQRHQRLQQDALHLQQLCQSTLEDAAASAERHQTEEQQMKQQLADMAAAVGAADAARRTAQRDGAAVLQAMAHITLQRDTASRDIQNLNQHLAAAQAEAAEANLLLAAAREELAAAPEVLRQKAEEAEQKAAQAEQRAAVAEALKVRAELECSYIQARYKRKVEEIEPILESYEQEALDALDAKGQLLAEVAQLKRALQLQQKRSGAAGS